MILTVNVLTQSSARITAAAVHAAKHLDVEGIQLPAWTNNGFLALTWVATTLIWSGLIWVVVGAVAIAKSLKGTRLRSGQRQREDDVENESQITLVGSGSVGK
jgi:hypothetical protein